MLSRFFRFVELPTKLVSILAFFTGLAYTLYAYGYVHVRYTAYFFAAMLLFDMATTAVNNFVDKRAEGAVPHFSTPASVAMIMVMLGFSVLLGLLLVRHCGVVVLLTGLFCFGMGLAYTLGPAPISHTPYGEVLSGAVMGFCIPFLTVYVNAPRQELLQLVWQKPLLHIFANVPLLLSLLAVSMPCVLSISNIMLANNICDEQKDRLVRRHTLPYHIGKASALRLFVLLYVLAGLCVPLLVLLRITPPITLFSLLAGIPVCRNVRRFLHKQVKAETFVLAVQNFAVLNTLFPLTLVLGAMIRT